MQIIDKIRQALKYRQTLISFEDLGRTLAYSPFMPRIDSAFFKRDGNAKSALQINIDSTMLDVALLEFATTLEAKAESSQNFHCYALNLSYALDSIDINASSLALESISLLRRHSTLPIVHIDMFLERYQLLESALFGADSVIIPAFLHTKSTLSALIEFARKLSFEPIIAISDKNDLKMAIFSGASMLFIKDAHLQSLLKLVPQTQIILSDSTSDYGIDMRLSNAMPKSKILHRF